MMQEVGFSMEHSKANREADLDQPPPIDDPVLSMIGVGCGVWEHEPGDAFVDRLRSEGPLAPPATR